MSEATLADMEAVAEDFRAVARDFAVVMGGHVLEPTPRLKRPAWNPEGFWRTTRRGNVVFLGRKAAQRMRKRLSA